MKLSSFYLLSPISILKCVLSAAFSSFCQLKLLKQCCRHVHSCCGHHLRSTFSIVSNVASSAVQKSASPMLIISMWCRKMFSACITHSANCQPSSFSSWVLHYIWNICAEFQKIETTNQNDPNWQWKWLWIPLRISFMSDLK